jgi:hypothetical protein
MGSENLLTLIAESDRNILKVLKYLRETFSDDLETLRDFIFPTGIMHPSQSFLNVAFWLLENETLLKLFDELGEWKEIKIF